MKKTLPESKKSVKSLKLNRETLTCLELGKVVGGESRNSFCATTMQGCCQAF
jgi:hypothetical protein